MRSRMRAPSPSCSSWSRPHSRATSLPRSRSPPSASARARGVTARCWCCTTRWGSTRPSSRSSSSATEPWARRCATPSAVTPPRSATAVTRVRNTASSDRARHPHSSMIDLQAIPDLRRWVRDARAAGRRVGLVPTMGYLHEGHLRLVDEARRRTDAVVMSLYVNPLQFGPQEDLARYPRDLARDRTLAGARGVDVLFAPSDEVMYPPGSEIRVIPGPTAERW